MQSSRNKRLSLLSETDKTLLYDLPHFDETTRADYFNFTAEEQQLYQSRSQLAAQVYCALQIGYFKAKQFFFHFIWKDLVNEDIDFILHSYFPQQAFLEEVITEYEYYAQRKAIATFFDYQLWSTRHLSRLRNHLTTIVRRDATPHFLLTELLSLFAEQRIIRPGYTTLQTLISEAINQESNRLYKIIEAKLNAETITVLERLLVRDTSLSELAALKQDAKDFGYRMMTAERQKLLTLKPLYQSIKKLLPTLELSQQNLLHYASLAHYYTIYELRRFQPAQRYLYLLCYAWQRYQQVNDNLIEAFCYHLRQFEIETKLTAKEQFVEYHVKQKDESSLIGRLLQLFTDEQVKDDAYFGDVRAKAFAILPKEQLHSMAKQLIEKPVTPLSLQWKVVDQQGHRFKKHLRPLVRLLDFSSIHPDSSWLAAIQWFKLTFDNQQTLNQRPLSECPLATIPKSLRSYLLVIDPQEQTTKIQTDRYEFWVYRQLRKRLASGEFYLQDSFNHRCFDQELVSVEKTNAARNQLNLFFLQQTIEHQLNILCDELKQQWFDFNKALKQGKLSHLEYDKQENTLISRKSTNHHNDEEVEYRFYSQLPHVDITDVLRFVQQQTNFLSAFTPLRPRYLKQDSEEDNLFAVLIAQAMNHGNLTMAEISDIPYHTLDHTWQQYFRLATLRAANDRISNAIAKLSIFPYYSFDMNFLYGAVDGQKYEVKKPTIKARYSRKYFGKAKGVVAYTLSVNHVPVQGYTIGTHDHESYYVFDICHNNTSEIDPTAISGDMHSINKANFAILHWFNRDFTPRFTNLTAQLKHLYCGDDLQNYENFLIKPTGQINRELIITEWPTIERVIITLALKETTQSTLIRKLCTYRQNQLRKAIFEFDKLKRSIYTLKYLSDPKLQRDIHRSQNRLEAYHQLRAAIAEVNGKKQLAGKTDIEVEISNQCGRLIANAIIYYNSALLSHLLEKYQHSEKIIALLKKVSPAAWQHIHLLGHYMFYENKTLIDLDALVSQLILE